MLTCGYVVLGYTPETKKSGLVLSLPDPKADEDTETLESVITRVFESNSESPESATVGRTDQPVAAPPRSST